MSKGRPAPFQMQTGDIDETELTAPTNASTYHPYMGGDPQSEQSHESPTRPDAADTEQAKQPQHSGDGSHRLNQADDQSKEASVTSQPQKRRRFLGFRRKQRNTDRAEQPGASTEKAAKKSKIGLVGILITAIIGFFFGIGSNQVTDYVKQANDCVDALDKYASALATNFVSLSTKYHDHGLPNDQRSDVNRQYDNLIVLPVTKVMSTCPVPEDPVPGNPVPDNPVPGNSEYLNSNDVRSWKDSWEDLGKCFRASACSDNDADHYQDRSGKAAVKLAGEAGQVWRWGLVRRAKYELMHLR